MKTIQEQYNLLKEGKGNKDFFMKSVRNLFPEYVNQYTSYNDAVNILKSKSVISEGIGGLVTSSNKTPDWFSIFNENMGSMNYDSWKKELIDIIKKDANLDDNEIAIDKEEIKRYYKEGKSPNEVYNNIWLKDAGNFRSLNESKEAKAEEKKPTKDVTDMETRGFDYKDPKNIDNVYGQEFLVGYYAEMKDPKNKDKSVDELKAIVAKNLAKDNQHYVKDGQFGEKELGYTVDAPALGEPKEIKSGKYKSSGMEPVKLKEGLESDDELEEMIQIRPQKGGGGKRFIPSFHMLPKEAANAFPGLIKMVNSPAGVEMYISSKLPPVFAAIHRGRQDVRNLPPMLKKIQDKLSNEIINLIKNNFDNKTIMLNGEPMHKVNLPISKVENGDYKIVTPFAAGLKEDKLREFISQAIREMMGSDSELETAKDEARMNSEEGYVQHVNKTENGYEVSDWYDSDTTVVSYENGEEINNREDMFIDGDMHDQNYQWDDENPDLRDLGADPKLYEAKLRTIVSYLIKEELDMKHIEAAGEDAKNKAMRVKIDKEINMRKKKLKALTTLTELEEDSVNPKKVKELKKEIEKLEAAKKKLGGGKKDTEMDESLFKDPKDPNAAPVVATSQQSQAALKKAGKTEIPGTKDAR